LRLFAFALQREFKQVCAPDYKNGKRGQYENARDHFGRKPGRVTTVIAINNV